VIVTDYSDLAEKLEQGRIPGGLRTSSSAAGSSMCEVGVGPPGALA
jgi:hypothetical protein